MAAWVSSPVRATPSASRIGFAHLLGEPVPLAGLAGVDDEPHGVGAEVDDADALDAQEVWPRFLDSLSHAA